MLRLQSELQQVQQDLSAARQIELDKVAALSDVQQQKKTLEARLQTQQSAFVTLQAQYDAVSAATKTTQQQFENDMKAKADEFFRYSFTLFFPKNESTKIS